MSVLQELAEGLGTHERTLRRGLAQGLVRGARPTPRSVALAPGESRYLRANWPLLAGLRQTLRTERNVRLAALVGSAARGSQGPGSDVDLLVEFSDPSWRAQDRLRKRLADAVGRPVDFVLLEAAKADAALLNAALEDGRVLVDRDGLWPRLQADRTMIARRAARAGQRLGSEMRELLDELSDGV